MHFAGSRHVPLSVFSCCRSDLEGQNFRPVDPRVIYPPLLLIPLHQILKNIEYRYRWELLFSSDAERRKAVPFGTFDRRRSPTVRGLGEPQRAYRDIQKDIPIHCSPLLSRIRDNMGYTEKSIIPKREENTIEIKGKERKKLGIINQVLNGLTPTEIDRWG